MLAALDEAGVAAACVGHVTSGHVTALAAATLRDGLHAVGGLGFSLLFSVEVILRTALFQSLKLSVIR